MKVELEVQNDHVTWRVTSDNDVDLRGKVVPTGSPSDTLHHALEVAFEWYLSAAMATLNQGKG